jgi:hypothetical protein
MSAPADANTEILQLMQHCMLQAQEMSAAHIAISMVSHDHRIESFVAGDRMLDKGQLEGIEKLHEMVARSVEQWEPPPEDKTLGPSYACYNAAAWSIGCDYLVWLIEAEMYRIREGGEAPLRVGFWLGQKPETMMDIGRRQAWVENVFRPALSLIGAVEDPRAILGRRSRIMTSRPICEAFRAGEAVPRYRTPFKVIDDEQAPVTITLREAGNWTYRNSDLAAWYRFALNLEAMGERVVFVRDTARAFEPIACFETAPHASLDLVARMALYESARANLFVANGPATLAIYSDRPWLMFVPVEPEDSPYLPNRASFWRDQQGVAVGEQYPWSSETQRIVWEQATYGAICRAWGELRSKL